MRAAANGARAGLSTVPWTACKTLDSSRKKMSFASLARSFKTMLLVARVGYSGKGV